MLNLVNLKKKILEEKFIMNRTLKFIAQDIGIASYTITYFTSFVDDPTNSNEISFDTILKLIHRYYSKENEINEIVMDYVNHINKPSNLKMILEFADQHQNNDLLHKAIQKCFKSKNQNLKTMALIYELLYQRKTKSIDIKEYREKLTILKNENVNESKFLLIILESYIFYDIREYHLLKYNLELLDNILLQLKTEKYLLIRYSLRKKELEMRYYLTSNQLDYCRQIAESIINSTDNQRLIGSAFYTLGLSYLFESSHLSYQYLSKAAAVYTNMGHISYVNIINLYITLAKCIHDENITPDDPISDLDKIYYMAKKENFKNANELLQEYIDKRDNIEDVEPFLLFLKGFIEKDKDLLWQSYNKYNEKGELFFSNFPYQELNKIGFTKFLQKSK